MSNNSHKDFIQKSITCILEEAVAASTGIGGGIETYPLCDYIMQSVFLKMTGFQEQKMKCICWELATNDYEYRYKFSQSKLGECSHYEDKKTVYSELIEQIKKLDANFKVSGNINRSEILTSTKSKIELIFNDTNLLVWAQKDFNVYSHLINEIQEDCFAYLVSRNQQTGVEKENLFLFASCSNCPKNVNGKQCSNLKDIYGILYNHRNKVAHNTLSYQQNLPTLKTLADKNYIYENYFIRFAILILIDEIFIALYKKYLNVLHED